jgi:hypothetical protein
MEKAGHPSNSNDLKSILKYHCPKPGKAANLISKSSKLNNNSTNKHNVTIKQSCQYHGDRFLVNWGIFSTKRHIIFTK